MKFNYKKIQEYIKEPLPAVDVLREKIIFHAFEVESVTPLHDSGEGGLDGEARTGEDYELDIKILPDRASDAKEDRGMAREIAALFKLNLVEPDVYEKESAPMVTFSVEKISTLLGRTVTESEITDIFDAYHYHYEISPSPSGRTGEGTGGVITLFVPPWRKDIINVHDVCDEIGRSIGYDTVPTVLPNLPKVTTHTPEFDVIMNKKAAMVAQGYNEVMTYSLVKKGDYQVAKGPKGKDFLRTNLLDGLRVAYALNKQNEELLPNHSAKIFEIGKVFPKSGEELHVAWIDAKGEHEEILSTTSPDSAAQSHPLHYRGEGSEQQHFKMWSEYPFMIRDVSVWVPESTTPETVSNLLAENAGNLSIKNPRLFDQFTKEGRTSYGFRLLFQANDRTLTDDEINPIMDKVYTKLKEQGWEIR